MTRLLVAADGVSFAYGSRRVLADARFKIEEGERIALFGPNGAGKTTILGLITGRLKPETGDMYVDNRMRYGYMTQQFEFAPDATVGSLLTVKSTQVTNLEGEIHDIEERMADPRFYEAPGYEDVLTHYSELQREVQSLSSKGSASAALTMLNELGLEDVEMETKMKELSGGQKTRVLLAKALANWEEMDLLMLDEPTNHLDIETVEWLEEFLVERYNRGLILVAHDQYLMDNLATKILELDNHHVVEWDGNFTDYKDQKAAYTRAMDAKRRREFDEVQRQIQIIEEIKRRNRFDAQARSKMTRLHKMKRDSEPAGLRQKTFNMKLEAAHKSSNEVLAFEGVSKRFGDDVLLENSEMHISKGDKIGLIGPNGCGKTTILRMIVGLEKATKGRIHMAPGVKLGFFDQEHAGLDPNRKLIEEVRSVRPKMADEEARGILGRFLFRGEDAFKTAGKLSGGEKARLALAKFLIGETNFLVLDEPTNHLDLASQDVIEKALAEYDGTMLVVSHDRHFLDAVVTKIAVVAKRNVGLFTGNFSSTRTLTRLQEFQETGKPVEYVVRKTFKDYEKGVRYSWGTSVTVTGNETQTTKRLFKYAMERGWMERKE
ncbi:MAG: ABC-F family ATP-binding cassette domain-containing protein [Euryarchaeota archaeon]|nr:ABC-F family ATP-binding cassette domain-containing protein [Euryarchaeota archaeon]